MAEKKLERSNRPLSEVLESCHKQCIEENGRLLTEEEAIKFVDLMKKDMYEKGLLK